MSYRVAVCGAGPGGVVLARELARAGLDVVIYEKGNYATLGHDWSDAVELAALEACGLEMPALAGTQWKGKHVKTENNPGGIFERHAVPILQLYSPDYSSVNSIEFRMITTDRRNLGKHLADEAVAAGAVIRYGYEGQSLIYRETGEQGPHGVKVEGLKVRNTENGTLGDIRADLVVESSGFNSVLRRSLPAYTGMARPFKDYDFALVHREVRRRNREKAATEQIPDHYRYGFHSGYQWSHVHDIDFIDVGAGVRYDPKNPDPKDLIEEFINRHDSILAEKVRGGRSLCIVGPPLKNFVTNGFLVIGDAASTSIPTTGCGAGSAILSGLWAAEVICETAGKNKTDITALWGINTKFYLESTRGASLAALSALRTLLQDLDHDRLNFLFRSGIMDKETLETAVNGTFTKPAFNKKANTIIKGIFRPNALLQLNKAVSSGTNIYNHYRNYPHSWCPHAYNRWSSEADKLTALYNPLN